MTILLRDIFNHDFAACKDSGDFHAHFFHRTLTLGDLKKICDFLLTQKTDIGGRTIPGCMRIKSSGSGAPFAILAQLHGNEPAGLAGIALALALAEAGKLKRDVIAVIGNTLAARQYFAAWEASPHARQETRDAFRCGLDEQRNLLPDMNRIPVDFRTHNTPDHHTKRAQELYHIGEHIYGILDIHSARGNMLCITDHKNDGDLKYSPIRSILTNLAEAISTNASATVTVQTLKTILHPLPNIECQVGIEAGRHEAADSPHHAASFTLSLLHALGITDIAPLHMQENGVFVNYEVQPRITYADLAHKGKLHDDDLVVMAKECHALASVPPRSDTVIVKREDGPYITQSVADFTRQPAGSMEYAIYQYDEMEAVQKDQVVAVALPSGVVFKTTEAFSGIFVSKSSALYDKDPAVGPWPVAADKIGSIKFCYPCTVSEMKIPF